MKRFFCIFLSFAMIISAVFALPMFSTAASTDEPTATDVPTATIAPTPTSEPSATDEPEATPVPVTVEDAFADVSTPYIALMEAETGALLYQRDAYSRAFPASTTKVMTAIVALENIKDMNRVVTLGWRPVSGFGPTSSLMGLEANETIPLMDILYGLMMRSGNDAAKALAMETSYEVFGQDTEPSELIPKFVDLMNQKAAELGMNSTHFVTVDGRHDDNHYTTAYDFAVLMRYALQNPVFAKVIATAEYDVAPTNQHPQGMHFENSNRLISNKTGDNQSFLYQYCIGGKTGETNYAGYCLISACRKDDITLIAVQFGDSNNSTSKFYRYEVAKKLYDWGYENYCAVPVTEFGLQSEFEIQTAGFSPFDSDYGKLKATADLSGLMIKGSKQYLDAIKSDPSGVIVKINTDKAVAPIKAGDVVGSVEYLFYAQNPIKVDLFAMRDVAASSETTIEPHVTAFISSTPPPGSGKNCNLSFQRTPGSDQYSVWVYYDHTLYTMNSIEWHYLYCDNGVFRAAATADTTSRIDLYRRFYDSNGSAYYVLTDFVTDGASYVVVSDGMALCSDSRDGTRSAVAVQIGANDTITAGVTDKMVWQFNSQSNGYYISNGSKYLSRKAGSGVIFWILVFVLLLVIIIFIRILAQRIGGGRRGRRRRASTFRSTGGRRRRRRA